MYHDNDFPIRKMGFQLRHYLMCEPTFFEVRYSINPWMDPSIPTSKHRTLSQWRTLHDVLVSLGHLVDLVEPVDGLPDMVYSANGGVVVDGRVLVGRFRHPERKEESPAYMKWFRERGWEVRQARYINEGEGDFLCAGDVILAGTGFRSEPRAHEEAQEFFGKPVLGLQLIDERYYHLDTALAVLSDNEVMYNPEAFSPESRTLLAERFPDAIHCDEVDAEVFGMNAVSDGLHVILPKQAKRLPQQLKERGFIPISLDMTELLKGGGGAKCCTLELRKREEIAGVRRNSR